MHERAITLHEHALTVQQTIPLLVRVDMSAVKETPQKPTMELLALTVAVSVLLIAVYRFYGGARVVFEESDGGGFEETPAIKPCHFMTGQTFGRLGNAMNTFATVLVFAK